MFDFNEIENFGITKEGYLFFVAYPNDNEAFTLEFGIVLNGEDRIIGSTCKDFEDIIDRLDGTCERMYQLFTTKYLVNRARKWAIKHKRFPYSLCYVKDPKGDHRIVQNSIDGIHNPINLQIN